MKPGEIYLANFPFGDAPGMKLRLVLLLTNAIGPFSEVLVAYISSVVPTDSLASDLVIDLAEPAFAPTNLKVKSVLRLHKLATIHSRSLARRLGVLPSETQRDVKMRLRVLLRL